VLLVFGVSRGAPLSQQANPAARVADFSPATAKRLLTTMAMDSPLLESPPPFSAVSPELGSPPAGPSGAGARYGAGGDYSPEERPSSFLDGRSVAAVLRLFASPFSGFPAPGHHGPNCSRSHPITLNTPYPPPGLIRFLWQPFNGSNVE